MAEEEQNKINETLNESIAFLTPDVLQKEDILPKIIEIEKKLPTLEQMVDTQLSTLLNQLNIQEIV